MCKKAWCPCKVVVLLIWSKTIAFCHSLLKLSFTGSDGEISYGAFYTEGRRSILLPGRYKKVDHPSTMCFLYSIYMQRVVLVLSARKILVLIGTNETKMAASSLLTPVKRAKGPKLHFCFCRPPFLISLSNLLYLGTTRKFLRVK